MLVKRNHREKVSGMSDDEFDEIFAYLMDNFNDSKAEPEVPPELLQGLNCTPL